MLFPLRPDALGFDDCEGSSNDAGHNLDQPHLHSDDNAINSSYTKDGDYWWEYRALKSIKEIFNCHRGKGVCVWKGLTAAV